METLRLTTAGASIFNSGSEQTALMFNSVKIQLYLDPAHMGTSSLSGMLLRPWMREIARDTTIITDGQQQHPPLGLIHDTHVRCTIDPPSRKKDSLA